MSIRVSDRSVQRNYLKYLSNAQSNYMATMGRVETGKRFTALSEDVAAGTKVLRTRVDLYKAQKQNDTVQAIGEQLDVEESAMTAINDQLATIHQKVLKASQDGTGETGRQAIATELDGILTSIVQYANAKYDQSFVFGGSSSSEAPFSVSTSGKLLYNGVDVDTIYKDDTGTYRYSPDGAAPADDDPIIPMSEETYMDIGLGIKTTGTSVTSDSAFQISYHGTELLGFGLDSENDSKNLYNVIAGIRDSIANYDKATLDRLDTKLVKHTDEFRENLTSIGAKTSFLDTMQDRLTTSIDSYKTRISDLMGTKDAEEASTLTSNQYVLNAILQMGSKLLPTSLMDYLS